jgi:hypothetical protein
MRVELRSIKYAKFASEETSCYAAKVYIDGKLAGDVRNDGQGGPDYFNPMALEQRLNEYAKTLPPIITDYPDHDEPSKKFQYPQSAESICGELLNQYLAAKDFDRLTKSRVLFTKADGRLYQTSKMDPARMANVLDKSLVRDAVVILNKLPRVEALALFRKVG